MEGEKDEVVEILKKIYDLQKEAFADMHKELREIKVRTQEMGR